MIDHFNLSFYVPSMFSMNIKTVIQLSKHLSGFILFQLNKFIVHFCKAIHLFVLISFDWLTRYSESVIYTIWVTHRIAFDFSLFAHKLKFNFTFVWVFMFQERNIYEIFKIYYFLFSDICYRTYNIYRCESHFNHYILFENFTQIY